MIDHRSDLLLFRWRDAFCSKDGPPSTTRLVLWTLSKHMGMDGRDAFPNQETIAYESGLTLKAVKLHLKKAEAMGWISRSPRRRGGRASWRFGTDYVPRFPCPEVVPFGEPDSPKEGAHIGVSGANIGERDSILGHDVPTSSSKNSSIDLNIYKKGDIPRILKSSLPADAIDTLPKIVEPNIGPVIDDLSGFSTDGPIVIRSEPDFPTSRPSHVAPASASSSVASPVIVDRRPIGVVDYLEMLSPAIQAQIKARRAARLAQDAKKAEEMAAYERGVQLLQKELTEHGAKSRMGKLVKRFGRTSVLEAIHAVEQSAEKSNIQARLDELASVFQQQYQQQLCGASDG